MSNLVVARDLGKVYPSPKGEIQVLQGLDFSLERGEIVAVMGASGVGKTTFLNLIGGLDKPTAGKVFLEGDDIHIKEEKEKARLRNKNIGFVFQFYHLLPEFSALENVFLPLLIRGLDRREAEARAFHLLREMNLEERAFQRPSQLSGGEQQRVAIARALVNEPKLLLADEPTGNLDVRSGESIMNLILELHRKKGLSSIIVTHNERIARFCQKIYLLEDGRLKPFSPA